MDTLSIVSKYLAKPPAYVTDEVTPRAFVAAATAHPDELKALLAAAPEAEGHVVKMCRALWKLRERANALYPFITSYNVAALEYWEFTTQLWDLRHSYEATALVRMNELLPRIAPTRIRLEGQQAELLTGFFETCAARGMPSAPMQQAILAFAKEFHRIQLEHQTQFEFVLATLLGFASRLNDAQALACCEKLVPHTPTHKRLAFNLCCLAAKRGNQSAVLQLAARARQLGSVAADFRRDADFSAWLAVPEFIAAIGD